MNKNLLIVFVMCFLQALTAQQRHPSIILYDRGNAAVARKEYRTADSLFTLSLKLDPHPDSYYNRAVCRRQLNNFEGYCLDLQSASKLGDAEAYGLFWRECAKTDTVYKKNNRRTASRTDYDFVEHNTSYKYNTNFEYDKRDTSGNPILSKIGIDNAIIYRACDEVTGSQYIGGVDSLIEYIKSQTDLIKYIKKENLAGFIKLSLLTDENGTVKDSKIVYGESDEAVAEIVKGLLSTANWIPAVFNEKPVKFQTEISITYYANTLLLTSPSFINNGIKEVFKGVETMPEFPGGPMEMMKFIQKTIRYPRNALENGLSGKCFLKFIILPNGKVTNIEVLRGVPHCHECDSEAIRVIKMMPVWKPGTQNGKPVSAFFNLPINFQLR